MATTMTVKGQVTISKKVRDALRLNPGDGVDFDVNAQGQVVVQKTGGRGVIDLRPCGAKLRSNGRPMT